MFKEFFDKAIQEKKVSIQRFKGANEMSDADFLVFLKKLQPYIKSGEIDLSVSNEISVTEKVDGSPCNFGYTGTGEFFMESANSGIITKDKIEKFNNPFTRHFYEAFKFLYSYQPFQDRLKKASTYAEGSVSFASEMMPILTHKGDDKGNVVFASTKYNRNKLGNKGSFILLGPVFVNGSPVEDESLKNTLMGIVRNIEDDEWKVYDIAQDGKMEGKINFNITDVEELLQDEQKLQKAADLLKSRGNNPEKDALKSLLTRLKGEMQEELNKYAEIISSRFGGDGEQFPVEGIVLKIDLPDETFLVKGTSAIFSDIAENTWGTRKAIGNIEKSLTGGVLKDALNLRSVAPAVLNRELKALASDFQSDKNGEEKINEFAHKARQEMVPNDVTEQSIKEKAQATIQAAEKELEDTQRKWEENKKNVDPDTIEKTEDQLNTFVRYLENLRSAIFGSEYSGDAYVTYVFRLLLDRRIKSALLGNEEELQENMVDEEYSPDLDELDEIEQIEERKFEKVKLARKVLSSKGNPKAFARNQQTGRYILKAKDIKKLMRNIGYVFDEKKGKWIMDPDKADYQKKKYLQAIGADDKEEVVTSEPQPSTSEPVSDEKVDVKNKAIVWVGRAQPWHRGHDLLIREAKKNLGKLGEKIVVILVKGSGSDPSKNPLSFEQQLSLIGSIYKDDPDVILSEEPTPTGSIVDILVILKQKGYSLGGWVAGTDRISGFEKQFEPLKSGKYDNEFAQKIGAEEKPPFDPETQFIGVGREEDAPVSPEEKGKRLSKAEKEAAQVAKNEKMASQAETAKSTLETTVPLSQFSGTLSRYFAKNLDFEHWFKEVAPAVALGNEDAKKRYREVYNLLGGGVTESIFESFRRDIRRVFFK